MRTCATLADCALLLSLRGPEEGEATTRGPGVIAEVKYQSWTDQDVSLHTYFDEIAGSRPLSREREAELAGRIAAGDGRALEPIGTGEART